MLPCRVCREFMLQLDKYNKNTEILTDIKTKKTTTLEELLPNWWN